MAYHGGKEVSLGSGYEQRPVVISNRHEREGQSHRFAPYHQTQERRGEGFPENKVFVANLSYSVTWQVLENHMKKGDLHKHSYCN